MNTLQLSRDLSVRQIAAIVKKLSRDDKDKLLDLIWDYIYEYPKEYNQIIDEQLKKIKADPGRMIPFEEVKRLRLKK